MNRHYINGAFVDDSQAHIHISDLGFLRSLAVCDVFRTYHKRPFHLQDHLLRLSSSAEGLGLTMPHTIEEIAELIDQLLDTYPGEEALVRTIVTAGVSQDRLLPQGPPSLMISALPLVTFPQKFYDAGASVCTTSFERPFPQCKTLFYAPALKALQNGKQHSAMEALLVNREEVITEGLTSNFFAVIEGKLVTAPDKLVLSGITRQVTLEIAQEVLEVTLRPIYLFEVSHMEEAFITSCTKEILPVSRIDNHLIGQGTCGPISRRLHRLFRSYCDQYASLPQV